MYGRSNSHDHHPNQKGVVEEKNASTNSRRPFSGIRWKSLYHETNIIASLDMKKPFDRVGWTFLFSTLRRFGVRELFTNYTHLPLPLLQWTVLWPICRRWSFRSSKVCPLLLWCMCAAESGPELLALFCCATHLFDCGLFFAV